MNILSLFDGISCGQLALQRAGIQYDNYFASEIDKYAIQVTQHHFPSTVQLGDVRDIKSEDLPIIDLLIGGSPCQGFSSAGKGLNFEDPRSKLFFEFVRLLQETKPKYFMLENVRMKKEYRNIITEILGVESVEINSALVSAQNRRRLYWANFPIEQPKDKGIVLDDILEDIVEQKYYLSEACLNKNNKSKFKREPYTRDCSKTGTLIAGYMKRGASNIYIDDGIGVRMFTPLECERLMTVSDHYTATLSNTRRYHSLGNGWTVDVIAHIFRGLL